MGVRTLLVVIAAVFLSGCGELSRRTITDGEMTITPETVQVLAGDYRVMLNEKRVFNPPQDTYDLIGDLEDAASAPGTLPATFSIRFTRDKVLLTLKCQGMESTQSCDYIVVDNEVQLDVQVGETFNLLVLIGSTDKAPGFGRGKDGRLWMRCRHTGMVIMLFVIPLFPESEETVYFPAIPVSEDPPAID